MEKTFYKIEYPMLNFFSALQQNGYLLNSDDYRQFLKALKNGFGLSSKDDLLQICKMLCMDIHLCKLIY